MANGKIPQHKAIAMGQKVTGMKSGGRVGKAMGGPLGNPNGMPAQAQGVPNLGAGRPIAPQAVGMGRLPIQPTPPIGRPAMARGGAVVGASGRGSLPMLKTGIPDSPLTDAKRMNGVPGMKRGGKC